MPGVVWFYVAWMFHASFWTKGCFCPLNFPDVQDIDCLWSLAGRQSLPDAARQALLVGALRPRQRDCRPLSTFCTCSYVFTLFLVLSLAKEKTTWRKLWQRWRRSKCQSTRGCASAFCASSAAAKHSAPWLHVGYCSLDMSPINSTYLQTILISFRIWQAAKPRTAKLDVNSTRLSQSETTANCSSFTWVLLSVCGHLWRKKTVNFTWLLDY